MYKMRTEDLPLLLRAIAGQQELYVPVKEGGQVNFRAWQEGTEADFETLKTVKSPKDAFFPQCETLYTVKTKQNRMAIFPGERMEQDFVVFGVRACDARAFQVLDRVFLEEPKDSFYAARRAHGTIVALACAQPEETCFCSVFGIDGTEPEADAVIWISGGFVFWKTQTEKGERLAGGLASFLKTAGQEEERILEEQKQAARLLMKQLPFAQLSLKGWGEEQLQEKFDSPLWEELYRPCIACGTCTFVCPTCQCYDIKDYDTGDGVKRYRCWDSCMYPDFTMMAHGNSRTSQMQRFRQRFMHKLVYYPARYDGLYSCVGCGRCVEKCPVSLNIVKVIRKFAGTSPEATGGDRE